MPSGKRNGVFMEMLRILCLEFAFAVLLAFIVCLVGGLLFYGCWLIFLAVVNRVCPGCPVGNEGGFRLVVPKKGSDKSLVLFCVSCGCYAFARNMRGLFWLGCAIRKCESVYSFPIINLKCHSSKNVL